MRDAAAPIALVIGGFGAIGAAVTARLEAEETSVIRSSRSSRHGAHRSVQLDPDSDSGPTIAALPVLDAVVWAHGINVNDDVRGSFDEAHLSELIHTNVTWVARTLAQLMSFGRLRPSARLVVISSIWQEIARPGKLSYSVSKAAVGGLVRAAAADLAPLGIVINAVLPGAVDTPMTRSTLSVEQIGHVEASTGFGRLVTTDEVAAVVAFLCSPSNTAMTGQSVVVDLGFSVARSL